MQIVWRYQRSMIGAHLFDHMTVESAILHLPFTSSRLGTLASVCLPLCRKAAADFHIVGSLERGQAGCFRQGSRQTKTDLVTYVNLQQGKRGASRLSSMEMILMFRLLWCDLKIRPIVQICTRLRVRYQNWKGWALRSAI